MRLFDVDWPPGWVRGSYDGRYTSVSFECEAGEFTAVWYETRRASVYFRRAVQVLGLDPDSHRIKAQRVLSPSVFVATCRASEVVGQCLLFDTTC